MIRRCANCRTMHDRARCPNCGCDLAALPTAEVPGESAGPYAPNIDADLRVLIMGRAGCYWTPPAKVL